MDSNYQLIILGGGITGVAAAIAAARENVKILLIERYGFLGGAATNSLVNPFMQYYTKKENEKIPLNIGIFKMILDKLDNIDGLHENKCTFNEELLKIVLDRMVKENNVDVLFHSYLVNTERENNYLKNVTVVNKSGIQTFSAEYFIDCTGDADLAYLAKCPYNIGRNTDRLCQPMTLCFRIGNVNIKKYHEIKHGINKLYQKIQKQGKIKNPRENVLIFSHMADGVLHFNTTRIIKHNPLNVEDLSSAEMQAREQMYEMFKFLKNNIEGFENSTLLMSAPQIGVRESRMIAGEYQITEKDILNCIKFEDSIARGNYSIDIHNPDGSGTELKKIPRGNYYTIPYRALIPKDIDNLLVAGRCISATHEAQSAFRVMPICCCIGEGAGTAAGIAVQDKVSLRNVSISTLQLMLDKYKALY